MAKQYYTLRSFAKGMNTVRDPRDIREDEANFIQNMSIESIGKIKSAGSFYGHGVDNDGTGLIGDGKYVADRGGTADAVLVGADGYNLFYFESDHSVSSDYSLSHQTSEEDPEATSGGSALNDASHIDADDTAIVVDNGGLYKGGDVVKIDSEIMLVSSVSSNTTTYGITWW